MLGVIDSAGCAHPRLSDEMIPSPRTSRTSRRCRGRIRTGKGYHGPAGKTNLLTSYLGMDQPHVVPHSASEQCPSPRPSVRASETVDITVGPKLEKQWVLAFLPGSLP